MSLQLTAANITILAVLLGNAIAFAWGAAKLSGSVDRLEKFSERIGEQVGKHETRITVLEDWREEQRR